MSLILDALRKAERERKLGAPRSADALTQPFPPLVICTRRPLWPWLVAATAMLAGAALTLLLVRRPEPAPPAPVVAAAPVPEPAPAMIPADEILDLPPAEPDPAPQQLSELDELEADPELVNPTVIAPGAPLEPVDVEPVEEAPAAAAPEPEVRTITLDPAPEPPLKRYKDLSAQYRADFPKTTVDVHVWDEQPQLRWVMINGKRYREGETIVEGPRIAQVERDGIVFEFRGESFLYPIY